MRSKARAAIGRDSRGDELLGRSGVYGLQLFGVHPFAFGRHEEDFGRKIDEFDRSGDFL